MRAACPLLVPALAVADYSDLIAARDGSAVVFSYSNSFSSKSWFRWTAQGVVPYEGMPTPDGKVIVTSGYTERRCSFAGSTCFLRAPCMAGWSITTPTERLSGSLRRTELRLSPDAEFAWFQQSEAECRGMENLSAPSDPRKNGIYRLPGLQQITAMTGVLANSAPGARVFTTDGQVLLVADGRLSLSRSGPVLQSSLAREATVSADGRTIAYEDPQGRVWLTGPGTSSVSGYVDQGRSPRLSDDGSILAFLSPDGRLKWTVRGQQPQIGPEMVEFALSGDGRWVFAVDPEDNLIRMELPSMRAELVVPRVFQGELWTARAAPRYCPLPCYDASPYLKTYPGHIVILRGQGLDGPGWMVGISNLEIPLRRLSADQVWFQIPASVNTSSPFRIRIFNHGHPVEFYTGVDATFDGSIGCLGAVHADGELITQTYPASVGEVISLYVTGISRQMEPAPLDHLVPIEFYPQPIGMEVLWAGLAPGLFGIQQVNARVLEVPQPGLLFKDSTPSCAVPPVQ